MASCAHIDGLTEYHIKVKVSFLIFKAFNNLGLGYLNNCPILQHYDCHLCFSTAMNLATSRMMLTGVGAKESSQWAGPRIENSIPKELYPTTKHTSMLSLSELTTHSISKTVIQTFLLRRIQERKPYDRH